VNLESIPTLYIANSWSKFEPEAGQILLNYIEEKTVPATVKIDKCCLCGLEFANPMFAVSNDWYANFEKYGWRWEFYQCLKDLSGNQTTILEVGCGEGYFLDLARCKGYKAVGIDFNRKAVEIAKEKGMEAYVSNINSVKLYNDQKFNAVVFFHVIEHLDNLETFFKDISEIMPTNSTLHFSCPGPRRFTTHLENKRVGLRDVWDYPPFHQSRWNLNAADKLLLRFGWKLEKYLEEPFDWRGVSSLLVSQDLAEKKLNLSELSSFARKKLILKKMFQTLIPSFKYSGMSMYCAARRQLL